jgi:hypothetical protein
MSGQGMEGKREGRDKLRVTHNDDIMMNLVVAQIN